jgi:hypothetical protein
MNRRFSPIEKFKSSLKKDLDLGMDRDMKSSTPRTHAKNDLPERPRSAFVDRYSKPSPPFQRPRNPVGRTIEKEIASKPASTLPRSFKDSTQLWKDLGITTAPQPHHDRDTPLRNQSFRLPDMTGIQSLIDTTPKLPHTKRPVPKHIPIESVPFPAEEQGSS